MSFSPVVKTVLGICLLCVVPSHADERSTKGDALARVPATECQEAIKTFEILPGLRVDLVAGEPLVSDPGAMAFDERGRLFVAEMRGYSEQGKEKLGRIRLLEDKDHDGRYETSSIYVDGLELPTAVICYDGGCFVGAAPDLLFCKDTNGDGKADHKQVVFTGFGAGDVQGAFNSLEWGLDLWIHGSGGRAGGSITCPLHPERPPVSLRKRSFAFNPRTLEFRAIAGTAQFGESMDRWGNSISSHNSNPAILRMFDDRYLARNPAMPSPDPMQMIYKGGSGAEVFRISPVEAWRERRTEMRVTGEVKGLIEGGGKASGYFTGASGVMVYEGDALPEEFYGNAFIGEVAGNLVHRMKLEPKGLGLQASRADARREFLASKDIWFRPVAFANAPDGSLFVADMYREVVEHPMSLPPALKEQLDLTSGQDRGRIYRIVPKNFKQPKRTSLHEKKTEELIDLLGHSNRWHREAAASLLVHKRDPKTSSLMRDWIQKSNSPEGRIRGLYVLSNLGTLDEGVLLNCLNDTEPHVRCHALRLAESLAGKSSLLRTAMLYLVNDEEPIVRYQLAFSLGELPLESRLDAISVLAKRDVAESFMRMALLSSLGKGGEVVLDKLLADSQFRESKSGQQFLLALAECIGSRNERDAVRYVAKSIEQNLQSNSDFAASLAIALATGAAKRGKTIFAYFDKVEHPTIQKILSRVSDQAAKRALASNLSVSKRVQSIRDMSIGPFQVIQGVLPELLEIRQPPAIRTEAIRVWSGFDQPEVAKSLLEAWPGLEPKLRDEVLEALFARPARLQMLLAAIESEEISPREIPPLRSKELLTHSDKTIQAKAKKLFSQIEHSDRAKVIEEYKGALQMQSNTLKGKEIFQKNCASCHSLAAGETKIGPSLNGIQNRGAEFVLTNLLDPNREVSPEFMSYVVLTTQGTYVSGMILSETATSLTLTRGADTEKTVLREDIDEMRSSGQSIMPEGLEKLIDKQSMADLLAYLMSGDRE